MKNIFKTMPALALLGLLLVSCKKDENQGVFKGGTAPVLSATAFASPAVLDINNKQNHAITFSWTNPDYQFNTGLSSQDVTYTLQVDTAGSNFTNPNLVETTIANNLNKPLTVGELNTLLLGGWLEDIPHNFEFRIKSTLANNTVPLYSNVISYTITPFLDVMYPVPANLYITGSATPASWQCGCGEPELLSQKFTKVSSSKFELNIELSANNSYLFLPVYGSWSAKYGYTGNNNENNVNGDNFKPNGGDMKAPPVTKSYKITVDFKTGKFTVE